VRPLDAPATMTYPRSVGRAGLSHIVGPARLPRGRMSAPTRRTNSQRVMNGWGRAAPPLYTPGRPDGDGGR
jgi:hypothetical protein